VFAGPGREDDKIVGLCRPPDYADPVSTPACSVAIMSVNMLNHLGALLTATSPEYASGLGAASSNALPMLFVTMHSYGYSIAEIFFGLWLLPLGYLLFKSRYAPRALGAVVMAGSAGYLSNVAATFASPTLDSVLTPVLVIRSVIAEVSLLAWLMVKGLDVQRQDPKRAATVTSNSPQRGTPCLLSPP
jgi:hypothetical protein